MTKPSHSSITLASMPMSSLPKTMARPSAGIRVRQCARACDAVSHAQTGTPRARRARTCEVQGGGWGGAQGCRTLAALQATCRATALLLGRVVRAQTELWGGRGAGVFGPGACADSWIGRVGRGAIFGRGKSFPGPALTLIRPRAGPSVAELKLMKPQSGMASEPTRLHARAPLLATVPNYIAASSSSAQPARALLAWPYLQSKRAFKVRHPPFSQHAPYHCLTLLSLPTHNTG
jgi:hypothetical protein